MLDRAYSKLLSSDIPSPVASLVHGQFYTIIIESTYLIVLCLDCVYKRNIVEAIGICLNSLSMLFLVGIGMSSSMEVSDGVLVRWPYIVLLAVLATGLISASYATWKLPHEFAWAIYRHIADAD
ncbi:hypothetical protein LTR27_000964 [Elasticomyces elasticus]|nr:hypothetical protein LTR27_000964 [Elasticomyces elasticus]